ncbi:dimethylamine monooxygenase subunit DmmA family protein [Amphritea sp. 1_MG-2023]|uniref:dimethylamine monooxygenase subunit DmmA family protein n=1 Tax=Amphritea sp. 1_MG-2023 TaxID=3062670 RepID=UPI0026E2D059|nr:dimethylamine monooxygenase subunit DmmA family protein [Amphritea sp. 1_MG-2023]MDO6564505.1 dimethylamine monooxygenase subunit DmmA family protein [Amphritea sp. 1_MG-2023]
MQTEQVNGVASKPVYTPVELNPKSRFHLFIAEQDVPVELQSLYDRCQEDKAVAAYASASDAQLLESLVTFPLTGTLYLAGTEPFLWRVASHAREAGLCSDQVRLLAPISRERHLFCCHCHTITEGVTYSPYACSGCGAMLEVTDHFSRLHGAYFSFQANAEDSTDMPEKREVN